MQHDLTAVRRRNGIQWEDFDIRWPLASWRSMMKMKLGFNCTGQMVDRVYDVMWASGLLMLTLWTVSHVGGEVMVCAGISYGQRTQLHFIDGNLNAQRYRGDILWPIVVPQSTAWSTLCEGDVSHCMRQMVVIPDTDWFSDPCSNLFIKVSVTNRNP